MKRIPSYCLALFALAACDDDGGGSGRSSVEVDTQVESSKKVSELTDAEAQQFCDEVDAIYRGLVADEDLCETLAVAFTPDTASCESSVEECVQSVASGELSFDPSPGAVDCLVTDASARMGCEATVADLEACWGAAIGAAEGVKVSCADAGNLARLQQIAASAPNGPEDIGACAAIHEACPGLIQDPADADD